MRSVKKNANFSILSRKFLESIFYLVLPTLLSFFIFPDTSFARVFGAFGPENFIRSSSKPTTEVRQFSVQDPDASEFTMHIFYADIKNDFQGVVPSALVKLNGAKIVTPNEFSRNAYYIRKPVTLSEENTLSLELRGKPGSGIRVVITGKNDEPQVVYFGNDILPDGRNLFGSEFRYFWTVIDEPEGGDAVLSDPYSSNPFLRVSTPGEYGIELRLETDSFETDPFIIRLIAGEYPDFVPKPVETRVVNAANTMHGITVGPNIYAPPAPMACATVSNLGFQVLVLDRGSLEKIDNRTFNIPCGNQGMIDYLSSLADTSKYPIAPLVIVSGLGSTSPPEVCESSSDCPLGRALEGLGGTSIFRSNYYRSLTYGIKIPENGTKFIDFHYSLIGIPGMEENQGIELNSWDHMAVTVDDYDHINANIQGYFVQDINHKWTFAYPEFVQIETRTSVENENIIKVGSDSYYSAQMPSGALGGFQVLVLDRDTLKPAALLAETNKSFWTNSGPGYETESGVEQGKMYAYLNSVRQSTPFQRFVVIIASIGNIGPPIDYKEEPVFNDLINLIADYYGGTTGILNNLGPTAPSIVTYSLVGMNNVGNATYGLGLTNTVEESAPNQNLKIVMHKDKQGWYEPATTYTGPVDTASPDFNLLSVALQSPTPWPLYDQTTDPQEGEYWAAYRYISSQLEEGTDNIRSKYVMSGIDPGKWYTTCKYLPYPTNQDFSEDVFEAMRSQLCNEFNYVDHINPFMGDIDELLQDMQIAEGNSLETVYNMVKSTIYVNEASRAKYNAMIVMRFMLKIMSTIDPEPVTSKAMGVMNGILWLGMHLSKEQGGTDYTSVDSAVSDLKDQMNNLWNNCQLGSHIVLDMVKSDWGKLQYVGEKLMTDQESGGWQYGDTDMADWKTTLTNSLESYYFQSLLPASGWKIDYMKNTPITNPWNFGYDISCGLYCVYYCTPYCMDRSSNTNAYQVDSLLNGSTWYVLTDDIYNDDYCDPCACVRYDHSATLRDILFGNGDWEDSSGNPIGVKLNLSIPIFYERWLPASVYRHPARVDSGQDYHFTSKCTYWGP